jgi:hypothetical protein
LDAKGQSTGAPLASSSQTSENSEPAAESKVSKGSEEGNLYSVDRQLFQN